jgi:hypothetical protein
MRTKQDATLTHQEAFNIAWNGLKAQGWQKAVGEGDEPRRWTQLSGCIRHERATGYRCALGHVDLVMGVQFPSCGIYDKIPDNAEFARAHNFATSPADMERRFREYAAEHCLTIPDEPNAFERFMEKVQEPVLHEDEVLLSKLARVLSGH